MGFEPTLLIFWHISITFCTYFYCDHIFLNNSSIKLNTYKIWVIVIQGAIIKEAKLYLWGAD